MYFAPMKLYILLVICLPSDIYAIHFPHYECGKNGRFEYCIDGIPGCVIGCHCHPGFYFDTDTKICEPNAKLVQQYRRHFVTEPTRVPQYDGGEYELTSESTTTKTPLDSQVEAIAKDSEDLGDWLYNQFFKTIENQIINNTNTQHNNETRRSTSGASSPKKKTKKKQNKKSKSSKKKKMKKNDLRRKLLRITEDDSMFHSGSDSSSESSSDDSSSSDSDSESDNSDQQQIRKESSEHGHRKFFMISKKPKPPLPSFIFLPNYETPFYPPIGLPPPPAMPMYPMVPIPPMPAFPFPGLASPATIASETVKPNGRATTTPDNTENIKTSQKPPEVSGDNKPDNSTGNKLRKRMKFGARNLKNAFRKNYQLHRLQQLQKAMNPRMVEPETIDRRKFHTDNFQSPLMAGIQNPEQNEIKPVPVDEIMDNVDFKYLTQLIHKHQGEPKNHSAWSKSFRRSNSGPGDYNVEPYIPPAMKLMERRFPPKQANEDSLYSNLGQQIAKLIRKIDYAGDHVHNPLVGLGKDNIGHNPPSFKVPELPQMPIFNNRNSPRSYWDRTIRSPLNNFYSVPANILDYPQNNYHNLYQIESKVEVVASTKRPLTLQDLENIVNLINRAKSNLQRQTINYSRNTSSGNLNLSLMPQHNGLPPISTESSLKYSTVRIMDYDEDYTEDSFIKNTENKSDWFIPNSADSSVKAIEKAEKNIDHLDFDRADSLVKLTEKTENKSDIYDKERPDTVVNFESNFRSPIGTFNRNQLFYNRATNNPMSIRNNSDRIIYDVNKFEAVLREADSFEFPRSNPKPQSTASGAKPKRQQPNHRRSNNHQPNQGRIVKNKDNYYYVKPLQKSNVLHRRTPPDINNKYYFDNPNHLGMMNENKEIGNFKPTKQSYFHHNLHHFDYFE